MRGALDHTEELDRVLSHEFVHAVVAMLGGRNVPVWLNEGLATLLEPGGREDRGSGTGLAPALGRRWASSTGSFAGLPSDKARVAYALSTLAVRRMIELRSASAVVTLLRHLGRGGAFASGFHQHIGMLCNDFQTMIARY
jgi:hypothetical protein